MKNLREKFLEILLSDERTRDDLDALLALFDEEFERRIKDVDVDKIVLKKMKRRWDFCFKGDEVINRPAFFNQEFRILRRGARCLQDNYLSKL